MVQKLKVVKLFIDFCHISAVVCSVFLTVNIEKLKCWTWNRFDNIIIIIANCVMMVIFFWFNKLATYNNSANLYYN